MKPRQIKSFLEDAMDDPSIQPVLLSGPPGVGKSAMPKEVCEEKHFGFVDIRLAQRDPTDLRGVPAVLDGTARWLPPADLPTDHFCMECNNIRRNIIFETDYLFVYF